jgi:hypothetical protein
MNQKTEGKMFFAPTVHIKNEKANSNLFDSENKNSLLGYIKNNKLGSFPYLNYQKSPSFFGDDCDPNGKVDSKLIQVEEEIDPNTFEKIVLDNNIGMAVQVYHKKGFSINLKTYENLDPMLEQVDPLTETLDPTEAELLPGTMDPYPVECRIKIISKFQYSGITDLFIKRQYRLDPLLGINIAQPTHLGFAQQMPGQTKPTLIIEVPLEPSTDPYSTERGYPELISKLPKLQPNILINQPWLQAILMNEVEKQGEVIEATDIKKLQKKFYFLKKMVSLMGDMEISNEPHF